MLNFEKWFYTNEKIIEEGVYIEKHDKKYKFCFDFDNDVAGKDIIYLKDSEQYFGNNIRNHGQTTKFANSQNKSNNIIYIYI